MSVRAVRHRGRVLTAAGLLACCLAASACGRKPPCRAFVRGVLASPTSRVAFELAAGRIVQWTARGQTRGVIPDLFLWDAAAGREVAHAPSSGWLRPQARLRYRNASGQTRRYQLLIVARDADSRGRVRLRRDGIEVAGGAFAGGNDLPLALGSTYTYQAAAVPGGLRDALLLSLGAGGRLLALDEHGGPTGLPRLEPRAGVARLVVAAGGAHAGRISVYANDPIDADGDGVGRGLERALHSCDGADEPGCRDSPLSAYYERVPQATRDTDRDGLRDGAELFGVQAPALDLPRFGTDLRHKDVLIEVDHHPSLPDVGFSEDELAQIAALFAKGSARDLRNPDGRPGVRLHFDVGVAPRDPSHLSLFGDYGGSNATRATDYRSARKLDFTSQRSGYFRYAFITRTGRGQTRGDHFTVNRDLQRVTIFAHELGHSLGLSHFGHGAWGRANCKPNYYSIMNYLYQNRYEIGFSRSDSRPLDPMAVIERNAAPLSAAAALRDPPLELDVRGRDVDWNRDGLISEQPVRAGLLWATYKSCASAEHGLQQLASAEGVVATPVLIGAAGRLYALWLDAGRVLWRRVDCALGADVAVSGCGRWSDTQTIADVPAEARRLAAIALGDGHIAVAVVTAAGGLTLLVLDAANMTPLWRGPLPIPSSRVVDAPALALAEVDPRYYGVDRLLMLLYRDAQRGELAQIALRLDAGAFRRRAHAGEPDGRGHAGEPDGRGHAGEPDGRALPGAHAEPGVLDADAFALSRPLDARGQPIPLGLAPSLLALPTGELCGVFPDADRFIRVYCYARRTDLWVDLSARAFAAGSGPQTSGPVGMAFHRYRLADGGVIGGDPTRGALYLSFTEPESSAANYPDNPHYLVSEWLSAQHGAFEQLSMRWRGAVITEWTNLAHGTGLALYEDAGLTSLKALMVLRQRDGVHLDFLPFADGAYPVKLGAGSDFQVMERGICTGLRSERVCGGSDTAAY